VDADGLSSRMVELLRHGDAEGGACFRGSQDDPLTEHGWAALRAAMAPELCRAAPAWDQVLTSPARRCAEFALELGNRLDVPVTPLAVLRERHFGAWEGRTAAQIPAAELNAFWADPGGYTPPDAEPFADFRRRVATAWRDIQEAAARRQLVVTHGGVLRVIVGEVLGLADASLLLLEVPHACRTRIRLPDGAGLPSLVAHGC
jgi:broad specificity phosphatase PhoE